MSDRQHEFDQTRAIFSAMGSFWWRVALFFVLCWIGHYAGANAASAAEFLRGIWSGGPQAIFADSDLNPVLVPLSWIGMLLVGCRNGVGLLQLVALAVASLFVWLSEDRYIHGFAIAALTQPIDSFLVAAPGVSGDFFVGLVILLVWETFIGFTYWWCLQQME